MAKDNKESTTSVGVVSPLTDYADGITTYYLAPHFGRSYPVRKDGDITSDSIEIGIFDPDDPDDPKNPNNPKDPQDPEDPKDPVKTKKSPTLMDIELVSNNVVYDSANNPTATVVFKIRNSSGEPVKTINALVEKK